jgi:hypothetical protein
MRIFNLAILNIKNHVYKAYQNNNKSNEAAYAAYRIITGASVQESWHVVKPWIKKWEGKK